ncbi:MAG: class I SAM-dependent rRNA methyltransferase [Bacteroidota bacterium]
MKRLLLRKGKAASVHRRHPWVFSGALQRHSPLPEDGEAVEIGDHQGQYLATGHYQSGRSIVVRLCAFSPTDLGPDFWSARLQQARQYRQVAGLPDANCNCYRLVHGEGDGLPGLIIDIYGTTAVIQCHSIGMHRQLADIVSALQRVLGTELKAAYDKSAETLPPRYAAGVENAYCFGQAAPGEVREYGHRFWVDWETGQKTGFFLDQRENRRLLQRYVRGKKVLNAFCYSGGFSIYALAAGADLVHSVDVSKKAIEWTERNVALLDDHSGVHESYVEDVLQFLRRDGAVYEVMVVDPPAFAKNISKRHNAVQGYKRLNAQALRRLGKGGILFTFSCSQVVDDRLFYNTIVAAAIEAGRKIRVMHRLSQPADHPVSLFHPEGSYLKGLVLWVE